MIVCNTDDYAAIRTKATGSVQPGEEILQVQG